MLGTLENDVATSIAVLDRLPPGERGDLLDRLSRGNYRFVLGPGLAGVPDTSSKGAEISGKIEEAIGHRFPIRIERIPGDVNRLQAHLTLSDGSPLTIDVTPNGTGFVVESTSTITIDDAAKDVCGPTNAKLVSCVVAKPLRVWAEGGADVVTMLEPVGGTAASGFTIDGGGPGEHLDHPGERVGERVCRLGHTRTSEGEGWPRKAVGLAVRP